MSFICIICGGIVTQEEGHDFHTCSQGGGMMLGGYIGVHSGFITAIETLQRKGYRLIGYHLPSEWSIKKMASLVFNRHFAPDVVPTDFYASDLSEVGGAIFFRYFDGDDYEEQVAKSADDLRVWADGLPDLSVDAAALYEV